MQTGAMTMKSRMTVTEALKERELLKKRITKKIGQLGRRQARTALLQNGEARGSTRLRQAESRHSQLCLAT